MTDHTDGPGAITPQEGDHDPMIADRFRVLDRVTPPDMTSPAMRTAAGGSIPSDPSRRRSGFLMAVAASVGVVVIGIVAVVASVGDNGADVAEEAGDVTDVSVVADDRGGDPDTTAPLVVEGQAGNGAGADDPATGDPADPATTTAADGDKAAADGDDNPAVDDQNRPVSSDSTATTEKTASTVTTDVPPTTTTTEVPPTTDDPGGDSAGTVALRGTVTEVFTDCMSRLLLTETGEVVEAGPVTCDGGSYIVVDGTRVFTSSGFVSVDMAFDKHPSNLKPGTDVSVVATRTGGPTGPLTLDCDSCRVRIL